MYCILRTGALVVAVCVFIEGLLADPSVGGNRVSCCIFIWYLSIIVHFWPK